MNLNVQTNTCSTPKHLLIGLTGGIGSGKSTVANLFVTRGARLIDTDEISHALTRSGGAAIPEIRTTFGSDYVDAKGALDRSKMRELIFAKPAAKKQLESILHPLILKQVKQLASSNTSAPYTLVAIPLLFESPRYHDWLHRTLVVDCPEELQIERTIQRSGLDKILIQAIMNQQISRNQRLALADDIILNNSDLASLSAQVDALHARFLTIAQGTD
jgi:dephospho-CoA kinase